MPATTRYNCMSMTHFRQAAALPDMTTREISVLFILSKNLAAYCHGQDELGWPVFGPLRRCSPGTAVHLLCPATAQLPEQAVHCRLQLLLLPNSCWMATCYCIQAVTERFEKNQNHERASKMPIHMHVIKAMDPNSPI